MCYSITLKHYIVVTRLQLTIVQVLMIREHRVLLKMHDFRWLNPVLNFKNKQRIARAASILVAIVGRLLIQLLWLGMQPPVMQLLRDTLK